MVFRVFIFICLKPTVRKDIWMRTTSVTVMVIFRKDHAESYLITAMFSLFSTITNHIGNSILKDAQHLKILRTWINIKLGLLEIKKKHTIISQMTSSILVQCSSKCSLIFQALKGASKCSLIIQASEGAWKIRLHFKEHCTNIEDDISLIFTCFFFISNKLNFIQCWFNNFRQNLFNPLQPGVAFLCPLKTSENL